MQLSMCVNTSYSQPHLIVWRPAKGVILSVQAAALSTVQSTVVITQTPITGGMVSPTLINLVSIHVHLPPTSTTPIHPWSHTTWSLGFVIFRFRWWNRLVVAALWWWYRFIVWRSAGMREKKFNLFFSHWISYLNYDPNTKQMLLKFLAKVVDVSSTLN